MGMFTRLLNIVALIVIVSTFFSDGIPDFKTLMLVLPLILAPLFSLYYLCDDMRKLDDNIVSLYIKRKALEEKEKIKKLEIELK